ncbi:3-oxoacyl-[acyl-carrier-protein] synthase, KASIII [Rhodococcus aetherivorans]|uniref:3-oxoacyl-[acyl-carrier-protein] synthase, KASIII n=1 Tax=Rhodococcus aetherivorans TaxID=191292 RepID=A0ABQ0YU83_9NOCA|nr:3-oxoacyl-[acyl-carrier-protein] synthase III C-terminal domain-containing protein [Rhodococcus aetherivorans]ETT25535.1 3-Oxoacyl-(acyl-carrier-protein (ACP)) synthase III domain-containing protein [Rhodococcus rhodochrous ATCC 21198]NGP29795.1 3-oxoacyl-ACP synthase [Rhodococcus aetherivorans]GES39947.1 3-oxoacyl-[acyl-carrier-protein] synthase, KASIII [Rhodococcus aetherivorans]
MDTVSLIDVASYLPGPPITTDYFTRHAPSDRKAQNIMFRAPAHRHHVAAAESAVDMAERAIAPLIDRHGTAAIDGIDVLLTHTQLPDLPVLGCGAELARRLGMRPRCILDLHNGGCAAYIYMLDLARTLLSSRPDAHTALIVAVQNSAGQIFTQPDVRPLAQAAVPGDGCGVGLLHRSDRAPILDVECRHYPQFAGDMTAAIEPPRKYWEPGTGQLRIAFTESKIATVFARGNRLVPEVALAVCDRIGVRSTEVDTFVTNQPNRLFLRNWREALELPPEHHPDTFDACGNLFGAAIPVTLDTENRAGRIPNGALVLLAGFAHAGDFAAAAAIRWGAAPPPPPRTHDPLTPRCR